MRLEPARDEWYPPSSTVWIVLLLLVSKAGSDGKAKVLVKGKGVRLGMPVLPLAVPVRVQLASASGACWEAEFQSAGVIENTTSRFSARAHAD